MVVFEEASLKANRKKQKSLDQGVHGFALNINLESHFIL